MEIAEVVMYVLALVSTGFAAGWAASAGRMQATKDLDSFPLPAEEVAKRLYLKK